MATAAEKQQALADFDTLLNQAQLVMAGREEELIGPPPQQPQVAEGQTLDPQLAAQYLAQQDAYGKQLAAVRSNPLIPTLQQYEELRQTEAQGPGGEAAANGLYEARIGKLREKAMAAVDQDLVHAKDREEKQQSLIQNLMSFNIIGVIMSLVGMFSGVGHAKDMSMQMLDGAMKQDGKKVTYESVARANNLQSALMGSVGADPSSPGVAVAVTNVIAPRQPQAPAAPQPTTTQTQPEEPFNAPNGTLPGAQTNLPGNGQRTREGAVAPN